VDELLAFWRARLDEDEAAAKEAAADYTLPWSVLPEPGSCGGYPGLVADAGGKPVADLNCDDAAHIARHDPARALRDVAADRAILADYAATLNPAPLRPGDDYAAGLAEGNAASARFAALRRAAVYSDHPEYKESWKP
jgi:hypothetical protein